MSGLRLRVAAPAKINLHLEVLRLRDDGYHEVRTILQSVALADTLTVTVRPGPFTVRSRPASMPRDGDNLVWRAAARFWRALGRDGDPSGVAVAVRKVVPAGAGLGGASSDAASALRALREIWAPGEPDALLHDVAAAIGSDVPFFLGGGTVVATGRGERMERVKPVGPYAVVIGSPGFGVATAEAYGWWDQYNKGEAGVDTGEPVYWASVPAAVDAGGPINDLEGPVVARYPAIGEMVRRLRAAGAVRAAMTGSGSAVFGLFGSPEAAERARRAVRQRGWRTLPTRTTDAAEHGRLTAVARLR